MTIGKRKGSAAKGAGGTGTNNVNKIGGSLSKSDHFYLQQAYGLEFDPGTAPGATEATGGKISDFTSPPGAVYRTHVFTSSGTLVVDRTSDLPEIPSSFDYLVVGGGGAGGMAHSANATGGGGAGGVRCSLPAYPNATPSLTLDAVTYTITVGAGGVGVAEPGYSRPGSDSSIASPTAPALVVGSGGGAGRGSTLTPGPGTDGGSGGGADTYQPSPTSGGATIASPDGLSPTTQGFAGGSINPPSGPPSFGGGGGGAGSIGGWSGAPNPFPGGYGKGGYGIQINIANNPADPATTWGLGVADNPASPGEYGFIGGGGSGCIYNPSDNSSTKPGGYGGGGRGGWNTPGSAVGQRGAVNTGGGGGGSKSVVPNPYPYGGSGLVAIRYQIASLTATAKASGGIISFYSGKTIHTFVNSGIFVTPGPFSETCEYAIIAGGGSGGRSENGGGGGAGGYLTGTTPIGGPLSLTVTVGAGGNNVQLGPEVTGYVGSNSSVNFPAGTITCNGGGYGGAGPSAGGPGGSGGGASWNGPGPSPSPGGAGEGTAGQGNDGGNPSGTAGPLYAAGGGGGAGGAGTGGAGGGPAGHGGIGVAVPSTFQDPGSTVGAPGPDGNTWWIGGGGGGSSDPADSGEGGGSGGPFAGGGDGGDTTGLDGIENTGGGGGGCGSSGTDVTSRSGQGGSGVVMIAYPS